MYPDLTTRLGQDLRKINRNELYLICDYSLADGSFLLYHFISFYLRSPENGLVYILGLNHGINHYKMVLAKLGVQLQRQIDQERCRILDFSYYLASAENKNRIEAPWFGFTEKNRASFSHVNSNLAEEAMKNLYLQMKKEIDELTSKNQGSSDEKPFLIVIDCLSLFLDLRIPLKYLIHFVHYLANYVARKNGSLAILTKTDEDFSTATCDDSTFLAYDRLADYLRSLGSGSFETTFVFDVKPLATGWSQEVHGEVSIFAVFFR